MLRVKGGGTFPFTSSWQSPWLHASTFYVVCMECSCSKYLFDTLNFNIIRLIFLLSHKINLHLSWVCLNTQNIINISQLFFDFSLYLQCSALTFLSLLFHQMSIAFIIKICQIFIFLYIFKINSINFIELFNKHGHNLDLIVFQSIYYLNYNNFYVLSRQAFKVKMNLAFKINSLLLLSCVDPLINQFVNSIQL